MNTNTTSVSSCPVCGKVRAFAFPTITSITLGNGSTSPTFPYNEAAASLSKAISIPWKEQMFPGSSSLELVYTPSVPPSDLCYGIGKCAPQECPVCTFMIRPGDDHDCAKLANSVGRSGIISRSALADQFLVQLTLLRKYAELMEHDYNLSLDENGQSNASWLAQAVQAIYHATDEAVSAIMD